MSGGAPPAGARIPRATYRFQFHRGFRLAEAIPLVPYLARLGVSHLYASPLLQARPGSTHGYDIVDHDALNAEIGTAEDVDRLCAALRARGMGLVLDIVPNHMGVGSDNGRWMDVLTHGPASLCARFFDVDWEPAKPELRGRVLLPVLGDHYGAILDRGELALELDAATGTLRVRYWESTFPVDPRTYPEALGGDRAALAAALGDDPGTLARFESLLTAFARMPPREATDETSRTERARDATLHRQALAELLARSAPLAAHVAGALRACGGAARLHAFLERQAYRLAFWRTAGEEINYRRFFDINDLAGLRQEDPAVFEATHRLVTHLVASGCVEGLRIDHPDGLRDPAGYYARLSAHLAAALGRDPAAGPPVYLLAEKILQSYERLPAGWAIHGTTGYDFAPLLNGWFTHPRAERHFGRTWQQFTGLPQDVDDELHAAKELVMRVALASELTTLANRLNRLSEADVHTRDYTLGALRDALAEVAACFPVYRTYVTADGASAEDRRYVDWAIAQARKRAVAADLSVFDFVRRVLLLEGYESAPERVRREALGVALRFQQFTAPLMAKGLEDTVLYRLPLLLSLNEVGGNPRRFHTSTPALHRANAERARDWPHAMLTTSTHDTKRAEDVRLRIDVLTERPDEWRRRVQRWARLNGRRKRRPTEDTVWPGPRMEYLLYQTLVGAWPVGAFETAPFRARIQQFAQKAAREAKVHTSWLNPNLAYEAALAAFVDALLPDDRSGPFLADFVPFAADVAWFGALGSLSQQLLKLASPGVPDVYQGTELLDLSLVDPDNRRPVDYAARGALLDALEGEWAEAGTAADPAAARAAFAARLLADPRDGRAKLWLTARTLALRAARPATFRDGGYRAVPVEGARAAHVVAFARGAGDDAVVIVATRWHATATEFATRLPVGDATWGDTAVALPEDLRQRPWTDALGGATAPAAGGAGWRAGELLAALPVALLAAAPR